MFRRELKKVNVVKHSGDGYVTPIRSTWQYFDGLYFLRDQFTVRSSGGNLSVDGCSQIIDNENENSENLNVGININTQNEDECFRNNTLRNAANTTNTESHTTTSTPHLTPPSGPINKRKRQNGQDDLSNKLIQLEENKLRLLENQTKQKPDEDMSFFESLLPHIRTLTPQRKL